MSDKFGREMVGLVEHIVVELRLHNQLLGKRNEMLRESVDLQKDSLEALETPKALQQLQQQFAQALELWSCDVGKNIPLRFRQLQELLPDPVWEDDQLNDPTELVVNEVLAERKRQVEEEEYPTYHDDKVHKDGQLALVAACYAASAANPGSDIIWDCQMTVWPWAQSYDKRGKHGQRRLLVIAAALLVAEIERLDRKNAP